MTTVAKSLISLVWRIAMKYARQWAMKEARVRGVWLGKLAQETTAEPVAAAQAGYRSSTPVRLVIGDAVDPLRWKHEGGTEYRMDDPLITDGGSTPKLARDACKNWADLDPFGGFRREFYFHDAAYRSAGCWVRLPTVLAKEHGLDVAKGKVLTDWLWMPLSRAMADLLLFQQLPSSGGRNGEVQAIYRAVRLGAARAWRNHRRRAETGLLSDLTSEDPNRVQEAHARAKERALK